MRIRTLVFLALLGTLAAAKPALASSDVPAAAQQQAPDTATARSFDIPALPIARAVTVFAQQSGLSVELDSSLAANLWSAEVVGTFSAADALRRLLVGTGLTARFLDDRRIALARADQARTATLGAVHVTAAPRSGYSAVLSRTATKTATPLRDVPQAVTVVTRELMQDLSMQGMADVARLVPGVTMGQGEGNRDQPTIRGNGTTADFYVDGMRDDAQYFRDLYNVERVEALKGSNAMIFGRGGGGGALNRVNKEAAWTTHRELTLQAGSFGNARGAMDLQEPLTPSVAARLNVMREASDQFRDRVTLERYGANPTITFSPDSQKTRFTLGYEYFVDRRTADRGIPSFDGRPVATDITTFFGDPDASVSDIRVHTLSASGTRRTAGGLDITNRTRFTSYAKYYQNVFPGAVTATGDSVSISAYNNDTRRGNLFNQTDLTFTLDRGGLKHLVLVGAEFGYQVTDNLRNTGYFGGTATSVRVPVSRPTIAMPIEFRPGASDANNHVTNSVASLYLQDQIQLGRRWQLIEGLRYEHFGITYHDNRTDSTRRRTDGMISPRFGLVFKPTALGSIYASYSVSHLPSAGDQFSALTDVTRTLEPERFENHEIGTKWDIADRVALTAAVYRLDRTNTRAPHPTDPARTVQTGSQRTTGVEVGLTGSITPAWEVAGAYTNQKAWITSRTASAPAGARVPLVPRSTLSLWNRYRVAGTWGIGLGVLRQSEMFAAIDNTVTLPAFTEFDGAVYGSLGRRLRVQAYVENLAGTRYYRTAHSNNNISPGSPRAVRVSLTTNY